MFSISSLKEIFKKISKDRRFRYLFVGGSGAFFEYVSFFLLNLFISIVIVTNAVSFLVGLFYTFFMHRAVTFKGDYARKGERQLLMYSTLAILNLGISSIMMIVFVEWLSIHPLIAKILNMAFIVLWNFFILNKIIFKHR